jgi:hypothetical protein
MMVDIENLFQHVAALEGVRHPLDSPKALTNAGVYIENQLHQIDVQVNRHAFQIDGIDTQFFNVEGLLGNGNTGSGKPGLLITSHYDTVYNSPGADDNASGIAIMLEVARILKEINYEGNVGFVSFTLEEANPLFTKRLRELGKTQGVFDASLRYTSQRVSHAAKEYQRFQAKTPQRYLNEENWLQFVDNYGKELESNELSYFRKINTLFQKYPTIMKRALVGSRHYLKKVMKDRNKIQGVINLETIGYTSPRKNSQGAPGGITLESLERHIVDEEKMIGDFALIIGDSHSYSLAEAFFSSSKLDAIDLPSVNLSVPLDYNQILNNLPDILRSDHAPFWKNQIPAVMVTDTANFRNPYYHTAGDTIRTLDFEFMKKVCQATVGTVLSFNGD